MNASRLLISAVTFRGVSRPLLCSAKGLSYFTEQRRYMALFGITPAVAAKVWNVALSVLPNGARPVYLLWCSLFLKVYGTEHVNKPITGVDEKTFRTWVWRMI